MNEIHSKTSIKLKSNPEKYASKYPTKIEYYLKRGFSEKEATEKISEIQNRFSLEKCITRYGKEEGEKVFNERQEKWINTLNSKTEDEKIEINRKKLFNNSGYSRVSQNLFWRVYDYFQLNDIWFEELNSEIIRYDKKNKRHYKYDYVDFSKKKCIEFNGDYWHCNPKKYDKNYFNKKKGKYAWELWEYDDKKLELLRNFGYNLEVVWEDDYKSDKTIINNIINKYDKKFKYAPKPSRKD